MADRLEETGDLLRLSEEDVIKLLGEPSDTDMWPDWDLVYWLGAQRGLFPIDSEWLVLSLDRDGLVSEAAVIAD